MKGIDGFNQEKLNEIWESFDSDSPDESATKVVDDEVEQVMVIRTTEGQTAVSRSAGGEWEKTKSVGDNDYSEIIEDA